MDSKPFFEAITTLHQIGDFRLRKILARLRDSFESKEFNTVRWIRGSASYAGALTKRNIKLSKRLIDMLISGLWSVDTNPSCALDTESWN